MRHANSLISAGLAIALAATAAPAQLKTSVAKTDGVNSTVAGALETELVNGGADFQLICRGGIGLRVSISGYVVLVKSPTSAGPPFYPASDMTVVFNRSTQRPDRTGRNLQPGQCSPADFQLRDSDPGVIVNTIRRSEDVGGWSKGPDAAEIRPDTESIPEYLKDPNHYWSFWVSYAKGYLDTDPRQYLKANNFFSSYWKPGFYKGPSAPSTTHQSTATSAAMVNRSSTTVQETSSRFGGLGVHTEGHAGAPAVPSPAAPAAPPPIVAAPVLPAVFSPPLLQDGAQLWACVDGAAGKADPQACSGEQSAQAYCQLRDAQSGPELRIADAQQGIPVRAVNGDVCQNADACRVVSELQCDQ